TGEEDIMLITAAGVIIRMPVDQISQMGRNTQGVRLIRLEDEQEVATVAKAQKDDPEKPIFVFLHQHIKETVYGSHEWGT
ncbi:DNA gyrase C-terminal beta-propeller domain-containing protein, partial [Bacillus pumilus]|uniref:DNA gyrase C-terminal beta-propeller domain-containing protein n=1 Tax=Bacillus pumilus TaxID=1408 RepID=UPI0036F4512B